MSAHYFSPTPTGPEHRRRLEVEVWGRRFGLTSANGVFAADGLDRGTEILLRESVPPIGEPDVLDLGCGYGPVALGIALACPGARVDAVDVNERAVALCRDNAVELGVADRVRTLRPDQVEAGRTYDEIWSNPPIRIGKEALHTLLLAWLPRLRLGGRARLVVGKNLGADTLQRWLVEQGFGCERVASSKGFRVLVVTPRAS